MSNCSQLKRPNRIWKLRKEKKERCCRLRFGRRGRRPSLWRRRTKCWRPGCKRTSRISEICWIWSKRIRKLRLCSSRLPSRSNHTFAKWLSSKTSSPNSTRPRRGGRKARRGGKVRRGGRVGKRGGEVRRGERVRKRGGKVTGLTLRVRGNRMGRRRERRQLSFSR